MINHNIANLFKFVEEKEPKYATPWQILAVSEEFTDISDADMEKWIFSHAYLTETQKEMVLAKLPKMTEEERTAMSRYLNSKGDVRKVFLGQEYLELLPKYEIEEFAKKFSKENYKMLGWIFMDKIYHLMGLMRNKGRRVGLKDTIADEQEAAKFLHECGFEGFALSSKEIPRTGSLLARSPRGTLFTPNGMKNAVFLKNPKGK